MKKIKRYRARTEWKGVEIFDRQEGRVMALDQGATKKFFKQNHWNIEPTINTPFPKTPAFASAPRRIYWELTRKCNLNCKSCFNRFFSFQNELSMTKILSLAQKLYNAGVYEIRCTGGEPTMRSDFFDIVDELKKIGFYLSMGTNGVYSKHILDRVMTSPIDWIIISFDGANESSYSQIRGNNNFSYALKTLKELSSKGYRIRINTLIRKNHYQYDHLKELAVLCEKYCVESLNCIPLRPLTNDTEILKLQLTSSEFKVFIDGLNRLRQEHNLDFITTLDLRHTILHDRIYFKDRSCAAGREGAVISPYGEIYGCSYSLASVPDAPKEKREKYLAGNLLNDDFLSIWNDSNRWSIFRDLERYKHDKCKQCHYYKTKRCIGNCPIMIDDNPGAFDPYCYLIIDDYNITKEKIQCPANKIS
jgi:radical SAM protein with 4Fe4S-binding SPASM domain